MIPSHLNRQYNINSMCIVLFPPGDDGDGPVVGLDFREAGVVDESGPSLFLDTLEKFWRKCQISSGCWCWGKECWNQLCRLLSCIDPGQLLDVGLFNMWSTYMVE